MMDPKEFFWRLLGVVKWNEAPRLITPEQWSDVIKSQNAKILYLLLFKHYFIKKEAVGEHNGNSVTLRLEYFDLDIASFSLIMRSNSCEYRVSIVYMMHTKMTHAQWTANHDEYDDHGELVLLKTSSSY